MFGYRNLCSFAFSNCVFIGIPAVVATRPDIVQDKPGAVYAPPINPSSLFENDKFSFASLVSFVI